MTLVEDVVSDSAIRRLAAQAGDSLDDLFTLCRADITTRNPKLTRRYLRNYEVVYERIREVQEKDRLRAFQSPVRGEEIMEICTLKPSRAIGCIKSEIEEAILEGVIPNEYEPAKEYLLVHKDEWIQRFAEQ
jgi:tRNA nucleotidyltransferase (CCA-adding enzyme)